jgi:hypothetical protein
MRHALRAGALALILSGGLAVAAEQDNTGRADPGAAQNPAGPRGDTSPAGSEPATPAGSDHMPAAAPIGATPQTMPSTISADNAAADKLPTMAQPLRLTEAQRRQILDAIAGAPTSVFAHVSAKPAQEVPTSVDLQELPPAVAGEIPQVRGYKYAKLPDRAILVAPASRVVVGEIAK